jgi:predicted RNA-binding Zn-ribbon protein involved in translation (DUF1610 family)
MRHLFAASLLLFATPAFADDANILELQLEIQRLLNEQPVEVIRPVEIVPEQLPIEPAKPVIRKVPPLSIHVWPSGCIHGERAVAAIVPKLRAQNWKEGVHYEIVRSYGGPCPQFSWKGRSFGSGWNGWESFNADLRSAMGVRSAVGVAPVGVVTARSAPVRVVATSAVARGEREHSHLCSNCGREWWHRSSEAGPGSHNCPNCRRPQYVINRWR